MMPKVRIVADIDTGPGEPLFTMSAEVTCIELDARVSRDRLIVNALRETADKIDSMWSGLRESTSKCPSCEWPLGHHPRCSYARANQAPVGEWKWKGDEDGSKGEWVRA